MPTIRSRRSRARREPSSDRIEEGPTQDETQEDVDENENASEEEQPRRRNGTQQKPSKKSKKDKDRRSTRTQEEEVVEEDIEQAEKKKPEMSATPMMQTEERNMGAVPRAIYVEYLNAGKGMVIIPLLILSLVFLQGTQVMSSYW